MFRGFWLYLLRPNNTYTVHTVQVQAYSMIPSKFNVIPSVVFGTPSRLNVRICVVLI